MLVRRSAAKPVPARQSASHGLGWIGIILLAAWLIHATGFAEPPDGDDLDLPRLKKPYMQHQLAAEIARLAGSKAG